MSPFPRPESLLLGALAIALAAAPGPVASLEGGSSGELSEALVSTLEGVLQGRSQLPARRLADPELVVARDGLTVTATFVSGRSIYANSLGYFVYDSDAEGAIRILESRLVFPNTAHIHSIGARHVFL